MRGIQSVEAENWGHRTISGSVDTCENTDRQAARQTDRQTSFTACLKAAVLTELGSPPLT